ncbi:MAG: virulence RhuM family protein [Lachnospiraceae bacterium]|nr:virulence RhuM family protein [Lachnospiraceae bacterium]
MADNFIIYKTEDEKVEIDVRFEEETVWLTQDQIAELFGRAKSTINEHISNVYAEGELEERDSMRKFGNSEFSTKPTNYYNLDVIISVGYRVKSIRGTQFRQWATKRLNEYIRKGFTMDDERLKELGGGGYFKELLERIRDIRASEKVFYRQVLDIYATSVDYDPKAEISIDFFRKVQNKIHYAVHGETAAEVIYNRADAEKEFMGLKSFKGDRPHLRDVEIAKNYLDEKELRAMGQIVSGYLDFAERQAEREEYMTMRDWAAHLNGILTSAGEKLLEGAGSVSHQEAIEKAHGEYRKYQERTLSAAEQDYLDSIRQIGVKTKKPEST